MSSDEEDSVPVLPTESPYRSSSPSTELQDEYEELLQSAVVSQRVEATSVAHLVGRGTTHLSPGDRCSQINSQVAGIAELANPQLISLIGLLVEKTAHTTSRDSGSAEKLQDGCEGAQPNTEGFSEITDVELFISEANISKMENIMDTWTQKLKTDVLTELRKWRVAFVDQHKRELQKNKDIFTSQIEALKTEIDTLNELLHTYEMSNNRKDEMIRNLNVVMNRQKQKLEKMRAFTQWRLQYSEAKQESYACQIARQHYNLHLKRKVWLAWYSLSQMDWKVTMEQACKAKAEEVCTRLSENYEAQIQTMTSEYNEALGRARAEIEKLQLERERREVCMRKAFMRGVCALNMETLHLFNNTDGQTKDPDEYDPNSPPEDDPDADAPPHNEGNDRTGFGASRPHSEFRPGTSTAHTAAGHGAAGGHTSSGGVVMVSQRKPTKSVPARSSTQHVGKSTRNVETMSVAPPMTSTVDYHHPVTQQTVGQATASKFPRPSQQAGGWASSRMHTGTYSPLPWDEPGSAPLAHCSVGSPVHFEHPQSPTHQEHNSRMGMWYTSKVHPSTTAAHSPLPQGGCSTFHKQASGRSVTSGQQKPAKTITARVTAQPFARKSARSNLQVMGMTPPMTSIVVERHQPITQTSGQPGSAKSVYSSQQRPRTPTVVKTSSRTNVNPTNANSIKVVD